MRNIRTVAGAALAFFAWSASAADKRALTEAYLEEPLPPGFKVMIAPLEGPIYTTHEGRTLYKWPRAELRNGGTADVSGSASSCDDVKTTENAGLMSPYPAGLELPDLDARPSCAQAWPPVIAADGAKPIGKWTLIRRHDTRLQWAYNGQVLYTSSLDRRPGDTIGGTKLNAEHSSPIGGGGDAPAHRIPIGPPADVPGQFVVVQNNNGRQLMLPNGVTVYAFDGDAPNISNCNDTCLRQWKPVPAPLIGALNRKDWSVVERRSGERQWAYRARPLYTFTGDTGPYIQDGLDEQGWRTVFTQPAPAWPKSFTTQDTPGGIVLADSHGKTIYIYNCGDDSLDQLACDHPDTPQEYRYAVCGGGDPIRCAKTFPYVIAGKNETSPNVIWTIIEIDPKTGRRAQPGLDSLRVWAYRDRPVYTFTRDLGPGTARGQSWGEFYGARNGYYAFWLRLQALGRYV